MSCTGKATKYQPTIEEFKCPSCGAKAGVFCIDDPGDCANSFDCETLHVDDYLKCYGRDCGYDTNGKAFAALVVKRGSMIDCPHCKGKGKIKA